MHFFQIGDFSFKNMVYLFLGSENFLRQTKEFTCSWICHFDMFWYPFDTQTCSMEMYLTSDLPSLEPYKLHYLGKKDLAEYYVHNFQMCLATINGKSGIKVNILLGRRIISNVLTVFIPTTILLIISHMANQFQESYIDMVISVNLTVLLVLATL